MTSTASNSAPDYALSVTSSVVQTSAAGDRQQSKPNVSFEYGAGQSSLAVEVNPARLRQTLTGIGTSFTEASAFVLAHLEPAQRVEVMKQIFAEEGANFSLARTPIGATDFSVEGRYSYADTPDDSDLSHFSIDVDRDGFDTGRHPGIRDTAYDLLPMIQEALAIKATQQDSALRIMASAWTAPAWMKDIEDWYQPGRGEHGHAETGGQLKPEYEGLYADYLLRYLDAYRAAGVPVWALTPVNEPLGNNGQWESMHFSAESQRDFIKHHLGPKLHAGGYADLELYMLDHSRPDLPHWAEVIYSDPDCAQYVSGAAVHWYESTFKVYEDVFDAVHAKYPDYAIVHSEGCIDDLGKPAPEGILDPAGYQEENWFDNDEFWWGPNASDWAYSATWPGVDASDHPLYTPTHRYARNIIVSLNHWVTGWIDWNIVLDARGGPNHVGNYCGAPIMIDTDSGRVYYTPVYHVLAQLSRSLRPGDRMLESRVERGGEEADSLHACASLGDDGRLSVQLLNTTQKSQTVDLRVGGQHAVLEIDANALQTVQLHLSEAVQ